MATKAFLILMKIHYKMVEFPGPTPEEFVVDLIQIFPNTASCL